MAHLGRTSLLLGLFIVSQLVLLSQAVDRSKFKTCNQAPFCKRGRERANAVTASSAARYQIVANSVKLNQDDHEITAEIKDTLWPLRDPLTLQIQFIQNDVTRVRINEKAPLHPRFQVRDVLMPEALKKSGAGLLAKDGYIFATFGDRAQYELVVSVEPHPFAVSLKINGNEAVRLNSHGLLNFEQFRDKNPRSIAAPGSDTDFADPKVHKFPFDEEIDSAWEERFGSHTDSKPRGVADVSMDISFTGSEGLQIYGIPEHASTLALKNTRAGEGGYDEPYRLYNLDVFEYEMDSPMALYGAIPFIMSQSKEHSAAILWLNAAETFIDIREGKEGATYRKDSYWMSESGIIDVFLFPGPRPSNIFYQYGVLTGFTPIPPTFAVSYHQCRWNYKSEDDVKGVDGGFDENDIPYDVLWLDIEHTDGKKYFTWDRANFPTPRDMQDRLAAKGRKMVTIVDPHIKRDSGYYVHQQSQEKGLYVKNAKAKGGDYEGWCWPGSVSYLDFLRPEVRQYWANQFSLGSYQGSTPNLFTWNDMNEPSVFNGPEVTMPKDCLHGGAEEIEHRDVHNMYGFYNHLSTCQGLTQRGEGDVDGPNRPFVLTRSFFSGSQRYAAMWTGDNKANWEHLKAAQPMLMSLGLAGYSFAGADVGGFFGDPAPELLVRWYQAGAFQPFFRGHAHIDTKRREPWLFGEPYTSLIRDAIRTRYAYLPYVYTTFFNSSISGSPVMRPLFVEYPTEVATFTVEDQFLLGSDLMIRPVTSPGADTAKVLFPGSEPWYDIRTGRSLSAGGSVATVKAPIDKIPAYQRGGSIIPKRERARRSSALMVHDPFTLVVALDSKMSAEGKLYLDDGHSFAYQTGAYLYRSFSFSGKTLRSEKGSHPLITTHSSGQYQSKCTVERVIVLGISDKVSKIVAKSSAGTQELTFVQNESRLEIRKPNVVIDEDWTIEIA